MHHVLSATPHTKWCRHVLVYHLLTYLKHFLHQCQSAQQSPTTWHRNSSETASLWQQSQHHHLNHVEQPQLQHTVEHLTTALLCFIFIMFFLVDVVVSAVLSQLNHQHNLILCLWTVLRVVTIVSGVYTIRFRLFTLVQFLSVFVCSSNALLLNCKLYCLFYKRFDIVSMVRCLWWFVFLCFRFRFRHRFSWVECWMSMLSLSFH